MRFNSFEFVVFFAAFFVMFVSAPKTYRPLIVLMASYIFYAAWRASFLLLLLATTVVDFSSALVIDSARGPLARRAALATALTKQQKTDAALPVPDLVNRWAQLVPGTNFAGAVTSGNNVTVTPSNALQTVQQLEKVPVLTQELANETTLKANDDLLIGQQNKNIFDLNASLTGAVKLDTDHQAQCVALVADVKAKAAKSKRRWFIIGYIAGFASHAFLASKGL